jgi:4-hydroxybenzoate polyprenyltransferase
MNPNQASLFKRFLTYQKERYPFVVYFFLIGAFSFSAIAFSRISRGLTDFIELKAFGVCVFNTISLFFLLRILDEFKDKEDDAKYRTYLPVPRGLISLKELRVIGIVTFSLQILITGFFYPNMLFLLFVVFGYLFLMTKEFFVKKWLKTHQFWYIVSHMLIIPLVDVFASGFDWFLAGEKAPFGLLFFFIVSFLNGIVLEIGRKIKSPDKEEEGVLSYTYQLGTKKAAVFWLLILISTLVFAITATYFAGHGNYAYVSLVVVFLLCLIPAVIFIKKQDAKSAKLIELSSAVWTFAMYLILGGIPMLVSLFS